MRSYNQSLTLVCALLLAGCSTQQAPSPAPQPTSDSMTAAPTPAVSPAAAPSARDQYRAFSIAIIDRFATEWSRVLEGEYATQAEASAAIMEFLPTAMNLEEVLRACGADRATLTAYVSEQPDDARAVLLDVLATHPAPQTMRDRGAPFLDGVKALPAGDMVSARQRIDAALARVREMRDAWDRLMPPGFDPQQLMGQ